MKIKCISENAVDGGFTFGKIYDVIRKDDFWGYIVRDDNDNDMESFLEEDECEVLEEEPTKQASTTTTLQRIQTFTMNHKNLEISFEDGMITLRDWDVRLNQPMDYRCDTIEQLEELMGAWEIVSKFKREN